MEYAVFFGIIIIMNLTQLRYVKAVAHSGSFTQAAEECFVTQPTLSNGISQLENEFGQRLFTRTTRMVSLTPFGESMLPFIEAVLNSEKELIHQVQGFVYPDRKLIRIGISPLISMTWLQPILEDFRRENNGAEIALHEQNMADLYRMLEEDLLDFVLGVAGVSKANWESTPLYEEPLYFIPKGDDQGPRSVLKKIVVEDVADETFVMVPNACGLTQATRSLFRSHRKKLKEYSGEALSYTVLEEWAMLGFGAAILPKSKLFKANKKARPLVTKKGDEISLKYEAVWVHSESRPPLIDKFVKHILKPKRHENS